MTTADATMLDPLMGGGSVGEACLAAGRGYIGCELSPEYFEISRERLEEALASRG